MCHRSRAEIESRVDYAISNPMPPRPGAPSRSGVSYWFDQDRAARPYWNRGLEYNSGGYLRTFMALFLIAILMGLCTSAVSVLQAWIETFNRNGIIHIISAFAPELCMYGSLWCRVGTRYRAMEEFEESVQNIGEWPQLYPFMRHSLGGYNTRTFICLGRLKLLRSHNGSKIDARLYTAHKRKSDGNRRKLARYPRVDRR